MKMTGETGNGKYWGPAIFQKPTGGFRTAESDLMTAALLSLCQEIGVRYRIDFP